MHWREMEISHLPYTSLLLTSTRGMMASEEVVIKTTTTTWIGRRQDSKIKVTTGVTTTISTRTGHKVRGGEEKTGGVSRQTTSGRTQGEMTGEEEGSRDLASFGWRKEGAKLRTHASIPIPDDRLSFLQLLNRANYLYITQTNL